MVAALQILLVAHHIHVVVLLIHVTTVGTIVTHLAGTLAEGLVAAFPIGHVLEVPGPPILLKSDAFSLATIT